MLKWPRSLRDFEIFTPKEARRLFWFGLALFFLGLFVMLTWELYEDEEISSYDQAILIFISKFRFAALNGPAVDLTALGSPTLIALFTVLGAILLWLNRDWRGGLYLALGSMGAGVATWSMKHLVTRGRPDAVPHLVEVSGFSYPSGHSLAATSFYLLVAFLLFRHYRSWQARAVVMACAAFLIAGVCFSRLYLGVHYPSDVLSGALFGSAWVSLLTAFYTKKRS